MADGIVDVEIIVIVLMLAACLAAMALRRSRFPVSVALVITGIVLGVLAPHLPPLEPLEQFVLSQEMVLYVLLPPLIMVAAVKMDTKAMRREAAPVLLLSTIGVLISALIVAGALTSLTGMPLSTALMFGALISATDPLAVVATIGRLGAPKRLSNIIDGESLLNDATSIVIFSLALVTVTSSTQIGIASGLSMFITSFLGGILVGASIGLLLGWTLELGKGLVMVQATLALVAAYAAFMISEDLFSVSGVISVLVCGLMASFYMRNHIPPGDREVVGDIVDFSGFVANGLVFLLMGVSMVGLVGDADVTSDSVLLIVLTIVVVIVARVLMVSSTLLPYALLAKDHEGVRFVPVIIWGGLRGAIALALALSLSEDLPWRDTILLLTIGVVAFTMLVNGTTTGQLIKRLGLDREDRLAHLEGSIHRITITDGAIAKLRGLEALTEIESLRAGAEEVESIYRAELTEQRSDVASIVDSMGDETLMSAAWDIGMRLERKSYIRLYDRGLIGERALYILETGMDARAEALRSRGRMDTTIDVSGGFSERAVEDLWNLISPEKATEMRYRIRFETLSGLHLMGHIVSRGVRELSSEIAGLSAPLEEVAEHYMAISKDAEDSMGRLSSLDPSTAASSEVVQAGRLAMQGERDAIERLLADGLIDHDTRDSLIAEIDERSRFSLF